MDTHIKTKIEVIVEAPLREMVLELLEREGAKGYTVFRAHAGLGRERRWQRGQLDRSGEMISVVVIVDPAAAGTLMAAVHDLMIARGYEGIVYASEVSVIRGERF